MLDKKDIIRNKFIDNISDFLYYDRKEDEDLSSEDLIKAFKEDEDLIHQLVGALRLSISSFIKGAEGNNN